MVFPGSCQVDPGYVIFQPAMDATRMHIGDVMTREVVTVRADQTLREILGLSQRHRIRNFPVVEGDKVVGIVTDRDVKRATPSLLSGAAQEEYDRVLGGTTAAQVMTRNPYTVTPSMGLKDAVKVLIDRKYGALPVVEAEKLVGIVSAIDLLRAFHRFLEE